MLRKWGSWFGNSTVHKLEKSSRILHIFTGYLLSCSLNSSTLLVVSIHLRGGESLLVFCFRGLSRLVYHLYVVWLFASSLMNFWFTYQKKKKKTFIHTLRAIREKIILVSMLSFSNWCIVNIFLWLDLSGFLIVRTSLIRQRIFLCSLWMRIYVFL